MRITAIVDENGQVIAATSGRVGDPESVSAAAGDEVVGGVELLQGQTSREVEVSDELFQSGDADALFRQLSE
ncbi:hypothetical protein SAMN05660690_2933 [Geodermatophilus telluris]|uniref:Uncharacterized protein n=1 Tax=Geodermatophilus telluris TaxID=1190417 RepID=A0A1G6QIF2_9ACTN|nr:hypothetical protein [Geodermatophilus telluris]SDC92088.1 hypothetical protein SAMN05660690_2933 [Geodermatophilus telluris]